MTRAIFGAIFIIMLAAVPAAARTVSDLQPADPQPAADALAGGLAVEYGEGYIRHLDEFYDIYDWRPGPPLEILNYRSGEGEVLTSGGTDGIVARISGFIHFAEPGTYKFVARSNDGIEVKIAGERILYDPDVHSDRYSMSTEVVIDTAGWYELKVSYFERKATSTLQLYWQPPGVEKYEIVPAEVLAHVPQ